MFVLALLAASVVSEFIYESAPFPQCHASTIVETAPGEFLAAWFGGTREGAEDVAIWAARKSRGQWSAPYELAREHNIPAFNPVLFKSQDGRLWFYFRFGEKPSTWTSARRWSKDGGRTWSPLEYLPAGLHGPIKNKPLTLGPDIVLAGTSFESYRAWASWIDRSSDRGQTFSARAPLIYPEEPRYGTIQPALAAAGGNVFAFVRTTPPIGKVLYSVSSDRGKTWSELRPTNLPNPNSGLDAVGLRDGRLLLVYNHTAKGRSPLSVAVSNDGAAWTKVLDLETEPGEYSYPAVIEASDGTLHVTYTWRRQRIKYAVVPTGALPKR